MSHVIIIIDEIERLKQNVEAVHQQLHSSNLSESKETEITTTFNNVQSQVETLNQQLEQLM